MYKSVSSEIKKYSLDAKLHKLHKEGVEEEKAPAEGTEEKK